jgi:hypothetical protein
MATAVDKWPAYARLSAVAQAGHLPHSSYTITRDTTLPTLPLASGPNSGTPRGWGR